TVDDVFDTIVQHLPKNVDFRAELESIKSSEMEGFGVMKGFAVLSAKQVAETAKSLGFDFRFDGYLYVFNSQYWIETKISRVNTDSLVSFLTSAIEQMGLWGISQQYHTFVDSLCKQFLTCVLSASFRQNKTDDVLINFKNGTLEISATGYRLRDFDSK